MLKFHFNAFTWDHLVPAVGVIISFMIEKFYSSHEAFSKIISFMIIMICCITSFIHISGFAIGTVNQIAAHLDINVFTIKPKLYDKVNNA